MMHELSTEKMKPGAEKKNQELLSVKNVVIHYETGDRVVEAANNVSFTLNRGETLGLVGETGAGKTTIALGIMRLLPEGVGRMIQGERRQRDGDASNSRQQSLNDFSRSHDITQSGAFGW